MRHGTLTGYSKHRCKCDACAGAWRDYQREYARRRAGGLPTATRIPPRVSTTEAREHLATLLAAGWAPHAIAHAAGVNLPVVRRLLAGDVRRRSIAIVERILAIEVVDRRRTMSNVPAGYAARLLVEMRRAGFTSEELGAWMGVSKPRRINSQVYVRASTWRRLVTAYRILARQGRVPGDVLEEVGEL